MYKKDINVDYKNRAVSLSEFHCRLRDAYGVMRCLWCGSLRHGSTPWVLHVRSSVPCALGASGPAWRVVWTQAMLPCHRPRDRRYWAVTDH